MLLARGRGWLIEIAVLCGGVALGKVMRGGWIVYKVLICGWGSMGDGRRGHGFISLAVFCRLAFISIFPQQHLERGLYQFLQAFCIFLGFLGSLVATLS